MTSPVSSKVKILIWLMISLVIIFLLCPFGMHNADDGIILALTRRILDGEIPHLDFIHLRPAGTFFLWALPVMLFGDYTYILTKALSILQLSAISYFWLEILLKQFSLKLNNRDYFSLLLSSIVIGINIFWIFPLYTSDALFLCSLGYFLVSMYNNKVIRLLGYMLMGAAGLGKQNFFGFFPVVLLVRNEWKKPSLLFSALVPVFIYLTWLGSNQALDDFIFQMRVYPLSQTFLDAGVFPILLNKSLYRGLGMGVLFFLMPKVLEKINLSKYIHFLIYSIFWIFIFYIVSNFINGKFYPRIPIMLFGLSLIISIVVISKEKLRFHWRAVLPLLMISWLSSFSLTLNHPHSPSYLLTFIVLSTYLLIGKTNLYSLVRIKKKYLYLCTVFISLAFIYGRFVNFFDSATAVRDPHAVGDIYPGAKGIYVGELFYKIMKDLDSIVKKEEKNGHKVVILPNYTNYWTSYKQKNLLPVIWTQRMDIAHPSLVQRINKRLEGLDEGTVVIWETYHGDSLKISSVSNTSLIKPIYLWPRVKEVYNHTRLHYDLDYETNYFEIFRKAK